MLNPSTKTKVARPTFRPIANELLRSVAGGDFYLHHPRGDNNRLSDADPPPSTP